MDIIPPDASFTTRGSSAIRQAFRIAAASGRKVLALPDQGGWITYEKDAKKAGFLTMRYVTEDGILSPSSINVPNPEKTVFIVNSMPGYYALQDMEGIAKRCNELGILLINDVSGSIGRPEAEYGDIKVGSFGRWKPIELGTGGFISSPGIPEGLPKPEGLDAELKALPEKISLWEQKRQQLAKELTEQGLIPLKSEKPGINIIIPFKDEDQKVKIISYCEQRELEYTLCPREIRVNRDAVCIELKRQNPLNQKP